MRAALPREDRKSDVLVRGGIRPIKSGGWSANGPWSLAWQGTCIVTYLQARCIIFHPKNSRGSPLLQGQREVRVEGRAAEAALAVRRQGVDHNVRRACRERALPLREGTVGRKGGGGGEGRQVSKSSPRRTENREGIFPPRLHHGMVSQTQA